MKRRAVAALLALGALLAVAPLGGAADASTGTTRYIVVLAGTPTEDGFALAGTRDAAVALVATAGGTVVRDLSNQIGVLVAESPNALFADLLRASPLVEEAAESFRWKAFPSNEEALRSGELSVISEADLSHIGDNEVGGGPEDTEDTLEPLQWSMRLTCAEEDPDRLATCPESAHVYQAGSKLVEVGILDTGIDHTHPDFVDSDGSNVNCAKGADFIPAGPGVGVPTQCSTDNNFHGTHVAGIVGARAGNPISLPPGAPPVLVRAIEQLGTGIVGVAPNIELIPVKVCDSVGYCYADSTAAGITWAGLKKFEVINMSFFVDDDVFLQSTEFKCMSNDIQRAFRKANERAINYARNQGVVPVAALGNSDQDLAHPVDDSGQPITNECEVVPAETQGVIGTMALGRFSEKAGYSNYGVGMTDVAAAGGNFGLLSDTPNEFCEEQVLSTIPVTLGAYGCFQGTSMASPHAAGVAALIVSQFGRVGTDAGEPDIVMRPQQVEDYLQSTTVDIGEPGYDKCFGNGRINALRAVLHDTSRVYEPSGCPEYATNP